jgi:hypothetical protein
MTNDELRQAWLECARSRGREAAADALWTILRATAPDDVADDELRAEIRRCIERDRAEGGPR